MGVASMVGLFYWGYSPFSLVAGVLMDRIGPRRVVPLGAAAVGVGALLFASGHGELASLGRLLQGAGGVFALDRCRLHRHEAASRRRWRRR